MKKRRLPDVRHGLIDAVKIGGHKIYLRTGEYDDGSLGEIFITIDKEGGELRVYDALAVAISIGLQYGVPLSDYCDKLRHMKMEPNGFTGREEIKSADSVVDYLAQWLTLRYGKKEGEQ